MVNSIRRSKTRRLFNILGPFFGLLLVVGLFSLSPTVRPYFLTGANFKIILTQTVIVALGTLGMTMIIVSGGVDLSGGSGGAFAGVVGGAGVVEGHPPILAARLAIAGGGGGGGGKGAVLGGP